MARRKMIDFTVRATPQQAARWGGAAQHDGAPNVAAWLATLATARLRYLGRFIPRMALRWHRAHFNALRLPYFNAPEATLHEVNGIVAGCFGIYKDREGEDLRPRMPTEFHLVHVPTGSHLAKFRTRKACKTLARELAMLKVNWEASVPEEVPGPDWPRALDAIRRANGAANGSPFTPARKEEQHG